MTSIFITRLFNVSEPKNDYGYFYVIQKEIYKRYFVYLRKCLYFVYPFLDSLSMISECRYVIMLTFYHSMSESLPISLAAQWE